MTERKASVSELLLWEKCRLAWHYRQQRRLKPLAGKVSEMVVGTVVHSLVLDKLSGLLSVDIEAESQKRLLTAFEEDPDKVKKYLAGVVRAVGWFPTKLPYGDTVVTETPATVTLPNGNAVSFRPDIITLDSESLYVIEIKNTEADPLTYLLWNPQHRYYAALLARITRPRAIWFSYIFLPRSQKKPFINEPWPFSPAQIESAIKELEQLTDECGQLPILPREGRHCDYCEYNPICRVRLTGGDTESIIASDYTERPVAEHT